MQNFCKLLWTQEKRSLAVHSTENASGEFDENWRLFVIPGLWVATRGLVWIVPPQRSNTHWYGFDFSFFRKIPVMVWCIIPGWNEGRVLPNYGIFQTSRVTPPPKHVNPIGLTCLKTPNAKHLEKVPRPDRDPGAALYTCKKLLHSIFQYKIFASSIGRGPSPYQAAWFMIKLCDFGSLFGSVILNCK